MVDDPNFWADRISKGSPMELLTILWLHRRLHVDSKKNHSSDQSYSGFVARISNAIFKAFK